MLLEKKTPKEALQCLLDSRKSAIEQTLKDFAKTSSTIPELLREVTHLIQWTLRQSAIIFKPSSAYGPDRSLPSVHGTYSILEHLLNHLDPSKSAKSSTQQNANQANMISSLYSEKTNVHIIFRNLPPNIQNHTFYFNTKDINGLITDDYLRGAVQAWVDAVSVIVKDKVFAILQHIDSGKQLDKTREILVNMVAAHEISINLSSSGSTPSSLHPSMKWDRRRSSIRVSSTGGHEKSTKSSSTHSQIAWTELCKEVLMKPFSLWEDLYRDVIKRLSIQVLKKSLQRLAEHPRTVVAPALSGIWKDQFSGKLQNN
jgi:hypothetical protein